MTETRALARPEDLEWSREQIELIKRTVAKDATDQELKLFLYTAKHAGLDPLLGQVHFIKRRSKNKSGQWEEVGQTLFGRDAYRIVAHRSGAFDGCEVEPVFDDKGALRAARATVYRKDMARPFRVEVYLAEYSDPERSFLWRNKPITMLCKVAEAHALRMAFPDLLVGSYMPEELGYDEDSVVEGQVVTEQEAPKQKLSPPEPQAINGKHWIDDPKTRNYFWAWTSQDLSLKNTDVYEILGVDSIHKYTGTMQEAKAAIEAWVGRRMEPESLTEDEAVAWIDES